MNRVFAYLSLAVLLLLVGCATPRPEGYTQRFSYTLFDTNVSPKSNFSADGKWSNVEAKVSQNCLARFVVKSQTRRVTASWSGGCASGYAHGSGIMRFTDDTDPRPQLFEGEAYFGKAKRGLATIVDRPFHDEDIIVGANAAQANFPNGEPFGNYPKTVEIQANEMSAVQLDFTRVLYPTTPIKRVTYEPNEDKQDRFFAKLSGAVTAAGNVYIAKKSVEAQQNYEKQAKSYSSTGNYDAGARAQQSANQIRYQRELLISGSLAGTKVPKIEKELSQESKSRGTPVATSVSACIAKTNDGEGGKWVCDTPGNVWVCVVDPKAPPPLEKEEELSYHTNSCSQDYARSRGEVNALFKKEKGDTVTWHHCFEGSSAKSDAVWRPDTRTWSYSRVVCVWD